MAIKMCKSHTLTYRANPETKKLLQRHHYRSNSRGTGNATEDHGRNGAAGSGAVRAATTRRRRSGTTAGRGRATGTRRTADVTVTQRFASSVSKVLLSTIRNRGESVIGFPATLYLGRAFAGLQVGLVSTVIGGLFGCSKLLLEVGEVLELLV